VRKSTAIVATLVAASSLAISLRLGDLATQENIQLNSSPEQLPAVNPSPSSTEVTASPSPAATSSAAPGGNPEPTPSVAPAKPKPKSVSKDSDVIDYKYGVIQLSMTMLGNEITSVDVIQGDLTNGRDKAYETLIKATVQVQGTNYGNVSGATFTTEAFKIAIENVLGKF
jgi:uncharacterized protein with FMN-binding domain